MAFGIIKADTLTHSTAGSLATNYVVEGSSKAWANIDDAVSYGTRDSFNISSYTSEATAVFSVSYTNNFSNDDYATTTGIRDGGGENDTRMVVGSTTAGYYTTSSQRNYTGGHNASSSYAMLLNTAEVVMLQVTGDLA